MLSEKASPLLKFFLGQVQEEKAEPCWAIPVD
jgi:hypothetical protein